MKGTIAVLTTGRQDYGLLASTIAALDRATGLSVQVWAGGMHLSERFGHSVDLLHAAGLRVSEELLFLSEPPDPGRDSGKAVIALSDALERNRPAALLLAGDRWETLAAGLAATIARVPLVHLHGGEETDGAFDNTLRHALTKLSHLHLVSHIEHARRVLQMGEHADSVVVVGAPGLDPMYRPDLPGRADVEERLGIDLKRPVIVVTVHPTTLAEDPLVEVKAVAGAMDEVSATWVVTVPNADPGGVEIGAFWKDWAQDRSDVAVIEALGDFWYWGLLRVADLVLGNSSSGIIEAPAAGVRAVNVGDRQSGRLRHQATVDVAPVRHEVVAAVRLALAGEPPTGSIYLDGPAAPRIVAALQMWEPELPPRKAFRDLAWSEI